MDKVDNGLVREMEGKVLHKCKCCEGVGWVYSSNLQGNMAYTSPVHFEIAVKGERLSIWQRVRNFIKK